MVADRSLPKLGLLSMRANAKTGSEDRTCGLEAELAISSQSEMTITVGNGLANKLCLPWRFDAITRKDRPND